MKNKLSVPSSLTEDTENYHSLWGESLLSLSYQQILHLIVKDLELSAAPENNIPYLLSDVACLFLTDGGEKNV